VTWEAVAAVATPLMVVALAGWIRWSIKTAVRETVNGGLTRIQTTVNGVAESQAHLDQRLDAHDQRHGQEQRQLLAALDRQGIAPPDGWRRRGGDG
jgi:hypothetical protein